MAMPKIRDDLMHLLVDVQNHANDLLVGMPKSGSSGREGAWKEYQRVRALQETLQEALEKLTN
jgi:hypothetical protein